tara:strand:+ start:881 stop:1795 length:915 start_codon:yes stop_codon:yes gene_type:complete
VSLNYKYSAFPFRGKLKWPNDAKIALILTLNLEYWDMIKDTNEPYYAGGPAVLPDLLPGKIADFPNFTWREYGLRVGIWRLFECFNEAGVRPSCTINAKTALERPQLAKYPDDNNWEIVAHNYEQGELLTNFNGDIQKEREIIESTLKVYKDFYGRSAKGWLSSSLRGTPNTPQILAENGCIFYCDIMNDDQPYLIDTDSGPIVSTPYTNEINDFTILTRRGHTTDEMRDILIEELKVLHHEASKNKTGKMMNVGLHPHVTGRAYRIRAVKEFLDYAKTLDGVWFATREEIAEWYLKNGKGHIA